AALCDTLPPLAQPVVRTCKPINAEQARIRRKLALNQQTGRATHLLARTSDQPSRKTQNMNPVVIIPARMAASRLPGKPLADIGGTPMILRVLAQARLAGVGDVAVAGADREIVDLVRAAGGAAVLT